MGAIGYTTLELLQMRILGIFQDGQGELSALEVALATECLTQANNIIRSVLLNRGMEAAEVSNWSRGAEFQLDIAIYQYIISLGKHRGDEETQWHKAYDRREELNTVELVGVNDTPSVASQGVAMIDLQTVNANLGY